MRVSAVLATGVLLAGASVGEFARSSVSSGARAAVPTCATAPIDGLHGTFQDVNGFDAGGWPAPDRVVGVPNSGIGFIDITYDGGAARQRIGESYFTGLPAPVNGDQFGAAVAYADFDGTVCHDLVIGAPGADLGQGAVELAYGERTGVSPANAIRLVGRRTFEHFGWAVAAIGSDVFIDAPDRTVSGHRGAGAVDHFHVSGGRATLVESITQNSPGVPGVVESLDHFGSTLSASGSTLAIGAPGEGVHNAGDAGTVTVLQLVGAGRKVQSGTVLSRYTPGVPGVPVAGEHFGLVLATGDGAEGYATYVAVGIPSATVGAVRHAGTVVTFRDVRGTWVTRRVITQNTPGIAGGAEYGDHFGSSVALAIIGVAETLSVIIGVPGEDLATVRDVGGVQATRAGSVTDDAGGAGPPPNRSYRQGAGILGGRAEAGDQLGSTVADLLSPYYFGDGWKENADLLQIGVPGQDVGAAPDAGQVAILDALGSTAITYGDSSGRAPGERYGSVVPTQ